MGQNPVIQTSFNSGEWAPALYGRVDLTKYHSGAALLQNFFVDYRGGATTRPGTRYVGTAKTSGKTRLIPFQASFSVSYMLEFGGGYIRFINNGAYVLEAAKTISAQSGGSPDVFTATSHGYSNGDWVFIQGSYYIIANKNTNDFQLTDLFGNAINASAPFTIPAAPQRVYTIASPYAAQDLFLIKYAQDVNLLFLCHPNYAPQLLTLNSATSWTLAAISFAPTISAPTGLGISQSGTPGTETLAYVITAVDINGQESVQSALVQNNTCTTSTTQTVTWTAVAGAISYNVYRSVFLQTATVGAGIPFGYIGSATGVTFQDTNIAPNFSIVAPTFQDPFAGASAGGQVNSLVLTAPGSGYTSVPTVSMTAAPPGGTTATAYCYLNAVSQQITCVANSGGWSPAQLELVVAVGNGVTVRIIGGTGTFIILQVVNQGLITSGNVPANPIYWTNGILWMEFNLTWEVASLTLTNSGSGYSVAPSVSFSGGGGAAATAAISLASGGIGNPAVPALIQQRSFFGGPSLFPSQFNMSQPGAPFNFNVSFPSQPDDAIQATLTSTTLHTIKAAIPVQAGLAIFTDQALWLLNGGSPGSPISATQLVANPQGYSGAGDLPPVATPLDIVYVQAKGSIVRDLQYNFYLNNYVGSDISVLSSHLFYGQTLTQVAWAEEPFKLMWFTRKDGVMLCLTFLKEQELLAWSHHTTQGTFQSVATVSESTSVGNVNATYVVVNRTVNGVQVNYIERMVELTYPNDYVSSWQVDAGISYSGQAKSTFSGAQHLGGLTVVGVADGTPLTFTMPTSGTFTLPAAGTFSTLDPATLQLATLSNGNLTLTSPGYVQNARSIDARATGKYYFELSLISVPANATPGFGGFGVAPVAAGATQLVAGGGTGGIVCFQNGNVQADFQPSGSFEGFIATHTNDIIGVAVDIPNKKIWFKCVAGPDTDPNWDGVPTADPATNTGGNAWTVLVPWRRTLGSPIRARRSPRISATPPSPAHLPRASPPVGPRWLRVIRRSTRRVPTVLS